MEYRIQIPSSNYIDSCWKIDFEKMLNIQIKYAVEKSLFYKSKFEESKMDIKLKSYHFNEFPFTHKFELIEDQNLHPPFGSNLCVDQKKIQRVHRTSGTTNKPLIIALTKKDIDNIIEAGSKCYKVAGLQPEHVVIHCLNYNMWMGGLTDHQNLEATGATVIPFGVGNSKSLIEHIINLKVNVISATPSYLDILNDLIKAEYDFKPIDLGIKLGLLGTESGLQDSKYRERLEELWGLSAINANFGIAEVLSMFGSECNQKDGLHLITEGKLYIEILDPIKMQLLPVQKGVKGELVITNLLKEAQPLIRYRTGDIIEILSDSQCRCGLDSFKFNIIGRSDDMLVIKGLNIFPSQIKSVISKYLNILTGGFRIIIDTPPPIENLYIKIEYYQESSLAEIAEVKEQVKKDIKDYFFISPIIEMVFEGTFPKTEGKSSYIIKTF